MTNAERLVAWRKSRGLSQEAAARKFGVAQGTWAPWESGKKTPSLSNAVSLQKLTRGAVAASGWFPTKRRRRPKVADDNCADVTPTEKAS